jgi:hypothetical protein
MKVRRDAASSDQDWPGSGIRLGEGIECVCAPVDQNIADGGLKCGGKIACIACRWAIVRQARLRRSGEVSGPLSVVDDQVGSPTNADDLAVGILALLDRGARGVYHLANTQRSTWWDFAREILDQSGYEDLVVDRIKTADLDLPAHRPANSVLDCSRAAALGISMRPWRQALRAYLESADGSAEGAGTS